MDEDRNQVLTDEQPVRHQAPSNKVVAARVIYYIAGVICVFLLARIILLLLAANQGSAFVDFVYGIGGWFAAPFYGIFSYQPQYGQSILEISSIVAILVYSLIATGLAKLVTLTSAHGDAV